MSDYVIKKGDNLTKIAKEYGTTVKALQEANNIKNIHKIIAGEKLIIPTEKGLKVEHDETAVKPDAGQKAAREAAHAKEVEQIKKLKESNTQLQEVTVIGKKKPAAPVIETKPETNVANTNTQKTEDLIRTEIDKRGLKNIDIAYWTEKINNVANKYNISANILTSIISRETAFKKNVTGVNGKGAMQQTTIAVKDFFPGKQGRFDIYHQLDSKLTEDILFKKDAKGNLIKNGKGEPALKYGSYNELLRACAKDDELSIKVGALLFKMQYTSAIARSSGKKLETVITELNENKLNIPESKNKQYIASAIQWYNGSPRYMYNYRKDVLDSLRRQNFDFAEPIIRKNS